MSYSHQATFPDHQAISHDQRCFCSGHDSDVRLAVLQAVDPAVVSSVSSAEVSLCSLSELIMLGIAAIASDPSSFGLLVGLSSGTVIAAALVYTAWVHAQSGPIADLSQRPREPACGLA